MLADFATAEDVLGERRTKNWFWFDIQTYLLLAPNTNIISLEEKFPDLVKKNIPEQYAPMFGLFLQPLKSIHLTSNLKDELEKNSNAQYSYILLTIALFIMLMACINFMNQTTASFSNRSVEIGVRKVFGAFKNQLVVQYLVEALVMTFVAFILGLLLVVVLLPSFNELTDKGIQIFTANNFSFLGLIVLFAMLVGLFSGSYPAAYLSGLKPINAIRGPVRPGKSSKYFRNTLVTIQVCVSLILIISTFIVSEQMSYFQSTNFGFEKEHIVIIPIKDRSKNDRHQTLTNELEEHSAIVSASFTSSVPGSNNAMSFYYRPLDSDKDAQRISTFLVDDNFRNAFSLNQLEGLDLGIDQKEDTISYIIVNQSFVDFFELEEPVGKLVQSGVTSKIIGVVEDFNIKSLHHKLEPALLSYGTNWYRYVAAKVNSDNIVDALDHMDDKWTSFYPGYPFDYAFLDDNIGLLYESEQKLNVIFKIFTAIALMIAGLGLVSLASFVVSQRTKEIGIRKVLGSSAQNILFRFSKEFLILIGIALIVGSPVTYFLMKEWLASFAFRIDITAIYFILPTLFIVGLMIVTIGYHVIKASHLNPVDTLRYE